MRRMITHKPARSVSHTNIKIYLQRRQLPCHGAGVGQEQVQRGQPSLLQPLAGVSSQILPPPLHGVRAQELRQGRRHAAAAAAVAVVGWGVWNEK